jgi:hypothetical protein
MIRNRTRCSVATITQIKSKAKANDAQIIDEAASKIAQILEDHFDEMGWSEEERNRRVVAAGVRIDAAVARARSSKSR